MKTDIHGVSGDRIIAEAFEGASKAAPGIVRLVTAGATGGGGITILTHEEIRSFIDGIETQLKALESPYAKTRSKANGNRTRSHIRAGA